MTSFNLHGVSNMNQFFQARRDLFKSQRSLAEITSQISSNQRFLRPSEDIGASSRTIRLQALLEQYDTFDMSIQMGKTKMETVDSVLSEVNALLIDLKAQALDMGDSGASTEMREATAEVVQQTLSSMVGLANSHVADQFLFSGFDSSQNPFKADGNEVVFLGDENEVSTQISQGQFLPVTFNPNYAFGALSVEKQSTADLNPRLDLGQASIDGHEIFSAFTSTTTLVDTSLIGQGYTAADLIGRELYVSAGVNEGQQGTITGYTPATGTITIDAVDAFTSTDAPVLSGATVDAVPAGTTTTFTNAALIGSGDLVGREVYVTAGTNAGHHGTISSFNDATGDFTIAAPDAFPAAFDATSVFTVATETNYSIGRGRNGTELSALNAGQGVQAGKINILIGATNTQIDLTSARTVTDVKERIESTLPSITVSFTGTGNGLVLTNATGLAMTVTSLDGSTTAEDLKLTAATDVSNVGGVITGGDVNPKITSETRVSDMAGAVTDPLSLGQLHVINGSRTADIDLSSATNVREMLNIINNAVTTDSREMYLEASINSAGTGIDIKSRLSGADFSISNFSTSDDTANELGLVTMLTTTNVSDLRNGNGLDFAAGTDFIINEAGTDYNIDLSGSSTIADIISKINTQTSGAVTASINDVQGNKLQIAGTAVTITTVKSNVAEQLGFTPGAAAAATLTGTDVAALQVDSIFTSTINLSNGLLNDDASAIQQAAQDLDKSFDTLMAGRSKVGGRIIRLDLTAGLIEKQRLLTQEDLSQTFDIDLTEALTELSARQVAMEAALATTARILDTSLLNFI